MTHKHNLIQQELLNSIPEIPRNDNEPVFKEPWQAEVFAIVLNLYEHGLFTWAEWAELLSQQILQAQQLGDSDLGDTYYNHWLAALEHLLVLKDMGTQAQLRSLYERWRTAAAETPHGQPIEIG